MGHLHRFYARNAAAVWQAEARLLQRLGMARPPAAVQWIMTTACDLECPHCYSRAGSRSEGELSTDEALRLVLDEMRRMGCPQLVLAGGEPLLRRDIGVIVAAAAERGIGWSLHTHGGLVPRHEALFCRFPPRLAAVSLDGPEPVHDASRGREGSFRQAMEAIALLRAWGAPEVVAGTTITRQNADFVADLYPIVAGSGAHAWGLHLFAPEGRGAEHRALVPTPLQLRAVAGFARRRRGSLRIELDNEWGSAGREDPFYRDDPFLCGAGRFTCVVGATGEVLPCTTTDVAESQGNVRQTPLSAIWAQGFGRFRDPAGDPCTDGAECWLQTRNGASCRAQAFGRGLP